MSGLDCFLFCVDWDALFPDRSQVALHRNISDHNPIVLEFIHPFGGPFPFKFEEIWFLEPDFLEVVEREWNREGFSGNPSRIFVLKLKALKHFLRSWKKNSGDSIKGSMDSCGKRINVLDILEEVRSLSREERTEREILRKEFLFLTIKEETFWRQRSRIQWLKEGDRNTKFFHKVAFSQRSANSILGLTINGVWSQDLGAIGSEVEDYYINLYKEEFPVRPMLDGMEFDCISTAENRMVERAFSKEEVWKAVSELKGDKVPGPDGFYISFY